MANHSSSLFSRVYRQLLDDPYVSRGRAGLSISTLHQLHRQAIARQREIGAIPPVPAGKRDLWQCGVRPVSKYYCHRRFCPFCWSRSVLKDLKKVAQLVSSERPALLFHFGREVTLEDLMTVLEDAGQVLDRIHERMDHSDNAIAMIDFTPLPGGKVWQRVIGLSVASFYRAIDLQTEGTTPLPGSLRMVGTADGVLYFTPFLSAYCDWMHADPYHVQHVTQLLKGKMLKSTRGAFRKKSDRPRRRAAAAAAPATDDPSSNPSPENL